MSDLRLSPLRLEDHAQAASIIHRALVAYYETHLNQGYRFGSQAEPFEIFPNLYEALDPGESIAAYDSTTQQLLGVCFVHERETHFSLGIVATDPTIAQTGIARQMVSAAIQRADEANKPLRLVSSLMTLSSFSLYTKLGFVPQQIFQDLLFTIPEDGLTVAEPAQTRSVREATTTDVSRLADYEFELTGIRREKDFQFFLYPKVGAWKVWIKEDSAGKIEGFLVVSLNETVPIMGPGAVNDTQSALALLFVAMNDLKGKTYVLLAPADAPELIQHLYAWGGKNIELHVSQYRGSGEFKKRIVFPTFLPESA